MHQKKVSIIIACYNDHEYIKQAVQSARDQTYENKEIIVIDDGSNSITKSVLKELEPHLNLIITQENKGASAARNKGIAAAKGDYIMILDSDDYYEKEFCEKAVKLFEDKPEVKLVTCYSKWFRNKTDFKYFKPSGGELKDFLIKNCALSAIFKKADFDVSAGYDEKMVNGYEDWEFYIRLLKGGGKAQVIPEVLFNYRNTPNSRNKKANFKRYELEKYIYLKHAELYRRHFEKFIPSILSRLEQSDKQTEKKLNSLEYKIGTAILLPFRWIKRIVS